MGLMLYRGTQNIQGHWWPAEPNFNLAHCSKRSVFVIKCGSTVIINYVVKFYIITIFMLTF